MKSHWTSFLAPLIFFISCTSPPEEKSYLFLGHPYDWQNGYRIDPRLEQLDLLSYDQIWLGGDVCSRTTERESTLDYLDSLFDLGSDHLQWTLGNHDVMFENEQYITNRTKRNTFYTTWTDGICLLVLNTNLFWRYEGRPPQDRCEEKAAQLALIESLTDTLEKASHLVILHHMEILTEVKKDEQGALLEAFNLNPINLQATCDSASYLTEILYPKLVKLQERGVEVVLVGGDFGMVAKEFAFRSSEGIWFLGSGINNSVNPDHAPDYVKNFDPDKVLVFRHIPEEGWLSWEFLLLNELVERREEQ